jgi:hypothetical protein
MASIEQPPKDFFFNDDDLTFFFLAQKIRHCHEVVFWAWLLSNTACSTLKVYWVLTILIFSLFFHHFSIRLVHLKFREIVKMILMINDFSVHFINS